MSTFNQMNNSATITTPSLSNPKYVSKTDHVKSLFGDLNIKNLDMSIFDGVQFYNLTFNFIIEMFEYLPLFTEYIVSERNCEMSFKSEIVLDEGTTYIVLSTTLLYKETLHVIPIIKFEYNKVIFHFRSDFKDHNDFITTVTEFVDNIDKYCNEIDAICDFENFEYNVKDFLNDVSIEKCNTDNIDLDQYGNNFVLNEIVKYIKIIQTLVCSIHQIDSTKVLFIDKRIHLNIIKEDKSIIRFIIGSYFDKNEIRYSNGFNFKDVIKDILDERQLV